jgi:hypothetical protein
MNQDDIGRVPPRRSVFSGSQQVVKFGPGVRQALPTHKMSILNYKNVILSISTRDEKEGSMLLTQRAE